MPGPESIADVFLSWRGHLARVVSRIVPPHEIEDIVQETYVRACQFKSKDEIQTPGAFMTRIARNLAIDHIKRAEARLTFSLDENTEMAYHEFTRLADEPFDRVATNEEFALFCEAVRHLPLQCRRAFVLKKVYGYSQREIAAQLELSESTVEKHVVQGIKRCTHYMRRHSEGERRPACEPRQTVTQEGNP